MAADFRALREESKQRRQNNREHAPTVLQAEGIAFTSHNGGAHLVVVHGGIVCDFWPGTGKWIQRKSGGRTGRGIRNLIKEIRS
jgi:hypothetical protein